MKKMFGLIIGLLVSAEISMAQLSVVDMLSFSGTGGVAAVTLPAKQGSFWSVDIMSMIQTASTGGNMTVYCPTKATTLAATSAGGTTLTMYTTASNTLEGTSITTADFVLVDEAGSYTLADISATGAYTNGMNDFTVGAFTATKGAKCYLVKAANVLTVPFAENTPTFYPGLFCGKLSMPVYMISGALATIGADAVYVGVGKAMKP